MTNKLLRIITVLLAFVMVLTSCEVTVNTTPAGTEPKVEVSDDGYLTVNGNKTEHKVQDDANTTPKEDEISVSEDGYVIVNGVTTEYLVDKEDVVTIDENGYVVVNGVNMVVKYAKVLIYSTYGPKDWTKVYIN